MGLNGIFEKKIINFLDKGSESADLTEIVVNRSRTEHEIRKIKRSGKKCPYEKKGYCTKIDVRCGERQNYSPKDKIVGKKFYYRCNYDASIMGQNMNILIVDDEDAIRKICRYYVENYGYKDSEIFESDSVENAEKLLIEAKKKFNSFFLVISDIRMGNNTGYELVNRVISRNYNAYIILMSGSDYDQDSPDDFLGNLEIFRGEKPVISFLSKPFLKKEFFSVLSVFQNKITKTIKNYKESKHEFDIS